MRGGTTTAREAARALLRGPARRRGDRPPPHTERPRRFRAVVAYDGAPFAGWQRQSEAVTVQEVLEAALCDVLGVDDVAVAGSGRTDAGVHADGQVAAFSAPTGLPASAIRHLCDHVLPGSVRVLRVEDAPDDFDPQRHAVGKEYRYLLRVAAEPTPAWDHVAWQVPPPLDAGAMAAAAAGLVGTHDFRAYRTDPGPERRDEDTVRRLLRLDVAASHDLVAISAEGSGFLYRMVRNLAAALVEVGAGRRAADWPADVLRSRDRTRLPPSAPAQGLCLVRVAYADGFGSVAHGPRTG